MAPERAAKIVVYWECRERQTPIFFFFSKLLSFRRIFGVDIWSFCEKKTMFEKGLWADLQHRNNLHSWQNHPKPQTILTLCFTKSKTIEKLTCSLPLFPHTGLSSLANTPVTLFCRGKNFPHSPKIAQLPFNKLLRPDGTPLYVYLVWIPA